MRLNEGLGTYLRKTLKLYKDSSQERVLLVTYPFRRWLSLEPVPTSHKISTSQLNYRARNSPVKYSESAVNTRTNFVEPKPLKIHVSEPISAQLVFPINCCPKYKSRYPKSKHRGGPHTLSPVSEQFGSFGIGKHWIPTKECNKRSPTIRMKYRRPHKTANNKNTQLYVPECTLVPCLSLVRVHVSSS